MTGMLDVPHRDLDHGTEHFSRMTHHVSGLTLWLRTRSGVRDGRRGREYDVFDAAAALRWTAFARRVPGPLDIFSRTYRPVAHFGIYSGACRYEGV
jgi:hypothetical protein